MFHIVGLEKIIMKLRFNQPFMQISRIFVLSLIALMVLGCAGEWGKPRGELDQFICSRRTCYEGPSFTMTKYIGDLNGSSLILELPLMGVFASMLMLFTPPRTYMALFFISWVSLMLFLMPITPPSFEYQIGSGQTLTLFSAIYLSIISIPLAVAEETERNPDQWFFWKKLFP